MALYPINGLSDNTGKSELEEDKIIKDEGNIAACPVTKEAWEARAAARKDECGGEGVYHCLSDSSGWKWEKCVQRSLIKEGHCPIFTRSGYIDWKTCNISDPACPNSSYTSDQVYKYSVCFGNNTPSEQTHNEFNQDEDQPLGLIIGVTVSISLIIAAILVYVVVYCRRTRRNQGLMEEPAELANLLPDQVDIVKDQIVKDGLSAITRKTARSIVVLGSFGSSVSSTSIRILEEVVQKMNWTSHQCRYTDIPDTVPENTIMFVYGWFGYWNDDLCSKDEVKAACTKLENIIRKTQSVKVVIGMRSDLHKDYHRELKEFKVLFKSEINLDGENQCTDEEYSIFFKEHIKDSCKRKACSCKQLTFEMLRDGNDIDVGMPLKIKIIGNYHELVSQYIKDWDILKVTKDHINALGKNEAMKHVYNWMKYICLKGRFSRSEEFEEDLVEGLQQSSFDENDTNLKMYFRMRNSDKRNDISSENAEYVFWHPFIYICVFHSLFEQDPFHVMKHCNLEAIFQLVRPKHMKKLYVEVSAEDEIVDLFNERLSINEYGYPEKYKNHPLVNISESYRVSIPLRPCV